MKYTVYFRSPRASLILFFFKKKIHVRTLQFIYYTLWLFFLEKLKEISSKNNLVLWQYRKWYYNYNCHFDAYTHQAYSNTDNSDPTQIVILLLTRIFIHFIHAVTYSIWITIADDWTRMHFKLNIMIWYKILFTNI